MALTIADASLQKTSLAINRWAKNWYSFARQRISAESRLWMASLSKGLVFNMGGWALGVIHSGVDRINRSGI